MEKAYDTQTTIMTTFTIYAMGILHREIILSLLFNIMLISECFATAQLSRHNFWPFIQNHRPEISPPNLYKRHKHFLFSHQGSGTTVKSKYPPKHYFWPFVPNQHPSFPTQIAPNRPNNTQPSNGGTRTLTTFSSKYLPKHNFWPFIPKQSQVKVTPGHHPATFKAWPLTTTTKPAKKKKITEIHQIPQHGFWPFIPIIKTEPHGKETTHLPPLFIHRRYNYDEVLYKSILFYEAQRSGRLPSNRKVEWRGHSALGDQGYDGEDLTGGWYDAGDYVKFGVPMATATTMLLWGLIQYGASYQSAGIMDEMRDCVRWPLDYFIKAHVRKYELYGQVGDAYLDHTYWGRPEDMDMARPAFKLTTESPGSDLAADTAAALASGYLAFKDVDPSYAKVLLYHAQDLFEFSDFFRGSYSDSIPNAEDFYRSYSDEDELAWAAIWLFKATKNRYYLNRARYYYSNMRKCWAQSWADKACAVSVLMYEMTKERQFRVDIESYMSQWLPGGEVEYTPKGLAFRELWGTLRYTANMAFIALVAADLEINAHKYRKWSRDQINYMLGDGGRSYVTGFGKNPPTRPHHASSSCPSPPEACTWEDYTKPGPNEHVLFGALVGGPDINDDFQDDRSDFIHTEVGTEYNGGFQSAVAGLKYLESHTVL